MLPTKAIGYLTNTPASGIENILLICCSEQPKRFPEQHRLLPYMGVYYLFIMREGIVPISLESNML